MHSIFKKHYQWYLLDATLPPVVGSVTASVSWSGVEALKEFLPVTLKGRIFQVLKVSVGACKPQLLVSDATGIVKPKTLRIKRLFPPLAAFLIFKRVIVTYLKLPRKRRQELALSFWNIVRRPSFAYRQAGRLRAFYPPLAYSEWISQCEALLQESVKRSGPKVRKYFTGPGIRPLIDLRGSWEPDQLCLILDSLQRQNQFEQPLVVLLSSKGDAALELDDWAPEARRLSEENLVDFLAEDGFGWVLWLTPQTVLSDWAYTWLASALARHPQAHLVYSDHDALDAEGKRIHPQFKPDWSLELARTTGYAGDLLVVARSSLLTRANAGVLPSSYGLALDLGVMDAAQVVHIPVVLWHQLGEREPVKVKELKQHLSAHGVDGLVETDVRGFPRIRYALSSQAPKVSVIIPTRNMLQFLRPCVESLLSKTDWSNLEVLIVDNQSDCVETLTYLADVEVDPRVRVLRYDQPFNFSAINNFAVEHAAGDVVCLLNNDTEVIHSDWLQEMVSRLLQPGVGVVGARLYFSDGRVQHAGDVLGPGGCATHLHGVIEGDDPGYMNRAVLPQDLSAVTAACLVTRKELFQRLGGLEDRKLPIAFNDVDYCLRVRESGWSVIYTPYAELYHHESVSRGKDDDPEKAKRAARESAYMRQRWSHKIESDPFYNPNLNYAQPDFQLGRFPRVTFPW